MIDRDVFTVRYIGPDAAEIRRGEIYVAKCLKDCNVMYEVKDRSGEWYAYPKEWFEIVDYSHIISDSLKLSRNGMKKQPVRHSYKLLSSTA